MHFPNKDLKVLRVLCPYIIRSPLTIWLAGVEAGKHMRKRKYTVFRYRKLKKFLENGIGRILQAAAVNDRLNIVSQSHDIVE